MLRKEIKDLNKQRDILDLWVGILNTVKVSILPKLINMFKAMPIKIPARFFVGINIILKFIWKGKETKVVETILKKKNKVENISPSNFETYYIATLIKTGWQDRYIDRSVAPLVFCENLRSLKRGCWVADAISAHLIFKIFSTIPSLSGI